MIAHHFRTVVCGERSLYSGRSFRLCCISSVDYNMLLSYHFYVGIVPPPRFLAPLPCVFADFSFGSGAIILLHHVSC